MIVDPARLYLRGDEDSSAAVDEFFAPLLVLASRRGCAVLIVHHLTKNADPATMRGIKAAVRGSSVWQDRPRVVVGLINRGSHSTAGIAKHNIPPQITLIGETELRRDPETQKLVPIVKEKVVEAVEEEAESASDAEQPAEVAQPVEAVASEAEESALERDVMDVIGRLNGENIMVRKSGVNELWRRDESTLVDAGRDGFGRPFCALSRPGT